MTGQGPDSNPRPSKHSNAIQLRNSYLCVTFSISVTESYRPGEPVWKGLKIPYESFMNSRKLCHDSSSALNAKLFEYLETEFVVCR